MKTCEFCGKEYREIRATQKYCCHSCCSIANAKKGLKIKSKACERCGREFRPTNNAQTWCITCLTRKCEFCGKEFRMISKSHENRAKYCSMQCKQNSFAAKMIGENAPNYKSGQRIKSIEKICKECGKTYLISPAHYNESSFCCKGCQNDWRSKNLRGEKGTNWKGGVSGMRERDMMSREYKEWRQKVFERDEYACRGCGDDTGGNLQAHHIQSYARYPELRYSLENGITLCVKCHKKEHKKHDIQSELRE